MFPRYRRRHHQSYKRPVFLAVSLSAAFVLLPTLRASAQTTLIAPGVLQYGDADLDGFGYPTNANPTAGASLIGLATGQVTIATNAYNHSFPFSPSPTDYAGTDQIYVGSNQGTSGQQDDGYSQYSGRIIGPQVVTFNYSSLIPTGNTITGLTFGIAADDFQFPAFGNAFTATINGVTNTQITNTLNGLTQTGPYEQFFSVGLAPGSLLANNTLTLTINEAGGGGDGWSTDFFTIGVRTTSASAAAPEPGALALLASALPLAGGLVLRSRKRRQALE